MNFEDSNKFFKNKKIYISPYTKTSNALCKKLLKSVGGIEFLGFIDREQKGENIFKIDDIRAKEFDYIIIFSPNHFKDIYKDFKGKIDKAKIFKVENRDNQYLFLNQREIAIQNLKNIPKRFKENLFKYLSRILDILHYKRENIVFISKNFISGNNKFFYFYLHENQAKTTILTDNIKQLKELKSQNFHAFRLSSLRAHIVLACAKWLVVDQGDCSSLLNLKSNSQKSMQLWHGIPLEHMNLLTNITYDVFISTSDFVSFSSFDKVFLAKEFLPLGYPRNDIFLKKTHSKTDLIFTDKDIYKFAKNAKSNKQKIIIYMPTFRESDFIAQAKQINSLKIDFDELNKFLVQRDTFFILKLHPFVALFYKDFLEDLEFSNVLLHNTQGDIYPVLKYADILVGDYSSVYYDFLLLDKPLIFYLYDHKTCSKMAHGSFYDFEKMSPGEKAYTQDELFTCIDKVLCENDDFARQRVLLKNKLFKYQDENSSKRILEVLDKI